MALIDLQHPWFIPLSRRVAVVAILMIWCGFELIGGSSVIALLTGGIGLICAWVFFFAFNPREPEDDR